MAAAIDTSLQTSAPTRGHLPGVNERQPQDLEECLVPGGAFGALDEARDAAAIRFIGMTSHNRT